MRGGLYVAAAAVLGALLANLLLADSGYVALRFAGRLVEMSAVTFLLLLVAAYFVVRVVSRAISAPQPAAAPDAVRLCSTFDEGCRRRRAHSPGCERRPRPYVDAHTV